MTTKSLVRASPFHVGGETGPKHIHNGWDHVRSQKRRATLRCRECGQQWRGCLMDLVRCTQFLEQGKCNDGPSCTMLHLFRKKESPDERLARIQVQNARCCQSSLDSSVSTSGSAASESNDEDTYSSGTVSPLKDLLATTALVANDPYKETHEMDWAYDNTQDSSDEETQTVLSFFTWGALDLPWDLDIDEF